MEDKQVRLKSQKQHKKNFIFIEDVQGESEKNEFFDFQKQPEGIQKK